MTTKVNNYLVRCDKPTAELLKSKIKDITGSDSREGDIKGIGGGAEIILFGTASLGAIKALLELIKMIIESGHSIKGIKVGDREVNDPKKENIIDLQKQIGESK
jgi:hypothetical protein